MENNKKFKVVLLGAGNVAWHLGKTMCENGVEILQVYSPRHAEELAKELEVPFTNNISELNETADMYLLALKDAAYVEIASYFPFKNKCMVHTSGSVDLAVFEKISDHRGVFYPFQTFTKGVNLPFEEVPVCVEASDESTRNTLLFFANKLTKVHYSIDSNQRKQLHLAGVFACNFTNAMYTIAKEIVEEKGMDFSLLLPLIRETARKVELQDPKQVQTGPAVRNDTLIMDLHLAMINHSNLKELYALMSKIICEKR